MQSAPSRIRTTVVVAIYALAGLGSLLWKFFRMEAALENYLLHRSYYGVMPNFLPAVVLPCFVFVTRKVVRFAEFVGVVFAVLAGLCAYELLQIWMPGRTADWADVYASCAGAGLGLLLGWVIFFRLLGTSPTHDPRAVTKLATVISALLVSLVFAMACVLPWLSRTGPVLALTHGADVTTAIFGNPEIQSAFATTTNVTAQRLSLIEGRIIGRGLSDYQRGPAIKVPDDLARQLQSLFQDAASFNWSSVKMCIPDYGVVFTFHSRARDVQIALCFHCLQIGVYDSDNQVNREDDFDPCALKLAKLVKTLFPDDKEIQGLEAYVEKLLRPITR